MSKIKNAQLRYRVIDRCLRNPYRPYPSKEDLRQACEEALYGTTEGSDICDSTIEKDLFAMRMEFDAPIKYSKRDKGYCYEDEDFSIDQIPLSEDDIEAIKFATNTLMQFRDVSIFKQFGFAIDKIFDRVHISNNPMDEMVDNYVQFENQSTTTGNELLPDLLKAIKERQIIQFNYSNYKTNKAKDRRVLPLLLKEYRNRWYLICYEIERSRVLTFGLDRISSLELTQDHYMYPVNFNPADYFKYSFGITVLNDDKPETVIFKIDKTGSKYIESQPLHSSQNLVKEGKSRDTYEIQVYSESEELKRTLLSYGNQLEVIKPEKLREDIRRMILEMNEIYG
ncbi:MAG: WYL domain-containing protein [Crocinitomicaceae bacterium]|nr:WYL domain-containing protein [Crocinitomicaceae bacterium]